MSRLKLPFGVWTWATVTLLVLAGLLPVNITSAATANRVGGWYLFGSNMPWLNWATDFGGGAGGGGVSGNLAEVDAKLKSAHDTGMHVLRWWVFEGGSWQIQRKAWKEGLIATLNERLAAPPSALPAPSAWPSLDQATGEYRRVKFTAEFAAAAPAAPRAFGPDPATSPKGV